MDIDPEKILGVLGDRTIAERLLHHERNNRVHDTGSAFYYDDPVAKKYGLILAGLVPRINDTYGLREFKAIKRHPRPTKNGKKKRRPKGGGGGRFTGLINGTKVHVDMHDFVVYDEKNYAKTHKPGRGATTGSVVPVHDYTTRLMQAIVGRKKWMPFLPEFLMFDEALGIGTKIDMVCVNKGGDLILLEFKTGYAGYFDDANGTMSKSLAGLANTPRQRATLQITVPALILHRRYGIPLCRMQMWVLRIDDTDLDIVPVPGQFLVQYGDSIYNDLLLYNQCDKKERLRSQRPPPPPTRLPPLPPPVPRLRR